MKSAIAVFVMVLVFSMTGVSGADNVPKHHPVPRTCTAQAFKPFSERVWRLSAWERGNPPNKVLQAVRKREDCAPPGHRKAMKATWERDRDAFFVHRHHMQWSAKYRSFEYPDGSHWAVPYPIAWCESGGHYYANEQGPLPFGAYGLIMEAEFLPAKVQDEIAYRLFLEAGEGPWRPYEGDCRYR